MKRPHAAILLLALVAVGSFYARARTRSLDPLAAIHEASEKHVVRPEMAAASRAMVDRRAPDFSTIATDGSTYELATLLRRGPVVLTFIKDGCPCSEAAQPAFNNLQAAYPGATVLGVIDLEGPAARRWAERFRAGYPLLLDPAGELVRAYGAENSAYVVLINPEGRIADHWPGYSGPMLRTLGAKLAAFQGADERPFDLADAPTELFSGCPY